MTENPNGPNAATDNSLGEPSAPLIITGMHRSGTSLTAGLLNEAGLHVGIRLNPGARGNPRGYFENLDFVRLHERIFNSLGYSREGWIFDSISKVPAHFHADAQETIMVNACLDMWGFKDPRAALLLDFWHEISPRSKFLFTARAPWQVADSLFRRGDEFFKANPRLAIEVWHTYNENILRFYRNNRSNCILHCLDGIIENQDKLIGKINEKFDMQLSAVNKVVFEQSLLQRQSAGASLFEEIVREHYPASLRLWHELQDESPHVSGDVQKQVFSSSSGRQEEQGAFERLHKQAVRERAIELLSVRLEEQSREQQAILFSRDTLLKENARLKLDLAQTRTGLENHRSETDRYEAKLEELSLTIQSLGRQLNTAKSKLHDEKLKTHLSLCQLGEARLQLVQRPLTVAVASAQDKESELIQSMQREIEELKSREAAIRSSCSWRVTAPLRRIRQMAHLGEAKRKIENALRNTDSTANPAAINAIVEERHKATCTGVESDPLRPGSATELPPLDIQAVTYNSAHWLKPFIRSLTESDYPPALLSIHFVDNHSTDSTMEILKKEVSRLERLGYRVSISENRKNLGFGAAHNALFERGAAPFCLITNVDLVFEPDTLSRVAGIAQSDDSRVAAWELRQKPYEHPKFYDPVTGVTNWNSHACVLIRRTAFQEVNGYDKHLFLYGEDVELSYRLRRAGYLLRYCADAVVWHYSYEGANHVKPLQFTGSTFANLYLRLKYGTVRDMVAIPNMCMNLLKAPTAFPGSRKAFLKNMLKLSLLAPSALLQRRASRAYFPFREWDYELTREGAFIVQERMSADAPLVSVITRTRGTRNAQLRQAILSVAHQTYPNIEHIVVEDGGNNSEQTANEIGRATGLTVRYFSKPAAGRAAAGNAGLSAARGKWCLFLDDDDLLFADHIETLVAALTHDTAARAAYSIAWEVLTQYKFGDGSHSETCHRVSHLHRQDFDYDVLSHHNYMPIQSVLFERRLFLEHGGMDERLDWLEDWSLWLRFAYENRFVYIPKVTSLFRTPAENVENQHRLRKLHANYTLARHSAEESIKRRKTYSVLKSKKFQPSLAEEISIHA